MSDAQVQTKKCTLCGYDKPVAEFYRNKATRDGYTRRCRACTKAVNESRKDVIREYYRKNKQKIIAQTVEYRRSTAAKKKRTAQGTRYRENYPNKAKAQYAVSHAVARGSLPKASTQNCAHCGGNATEYHHWSYEPEHRLDVVPLCHGCHMKVHFTSRE